GLQSLAGVAVIAVLGGLVALHKWIGRGPAVAALIFVGTLVPALGFFNIFPMRYTFVADHYAYHASAALVALAAAGIDRAQRRVSDLAALRYAVYAAVLLPLGVATMLRCRVYENVLVLWRGQFGKEP